MAINRYDTPAQAEFVNTYVPIPFDEMMKIGLMKQQLVEKNDQLSDELLATLGSAKVAKPDEPHYRDWQKKKQAELDEILSSGVPGSYEQKRNILKLRQGIAMDPEYRMWTQNYAPYQSMVTEYNKAKAEFGENSPAVYKLGKQIAEFNQAGTRGLMSKDGIGLLQPENVGKPSDIQPVLYEYLKPVKADLIGREGLDESGNFKIGTKVGQITPDKLGSVLGITFKTSVKDGRKVVSVDREKINYPRDIDSTPAGAYMRLKAEQIADASGGEITKEEAFKQLYADAAVSAINSHVSTQSEYSLDTNEFALAAYKHKLEKEIPDFSSNIAIASEASKFNSKRAVEDGLASFDLEVARAKEEKTQLIKDIGATEQILPDGTIKYIGEGGKDVTNLVREKQLEIEEYEGQKESLKEMYAQTKRDLRIPDSYEGPSEKLKEKAEKHAANVAARQQNAQRQGTSNQPSFDYNAAYEEAYNKYIESEDPYYKNLNRALKENAAKNSFIAKVTRFGDSDLNEAAETHFKTAIQNNAFFDTAGNELSVEEKQRLAKLSFVATEKGQKGNVHFEGALWNKEKHMFQFAYTVNDSNIDTSVEGRKAKKGVSRTILVEAPDEAVDILIANGHFTQAQQVIQQQMSMMNTDPNKEAAVYFGDKDKDPYAGMARQIRESEKRKYKDAQYILEVLLKDEDTKEERITALPFKDITEAGAWYERYRRQVQKLEDESKK